jgi:hypothetical protein
MSTPEPAPPYRLPSIGRRIAVTVLWLVPLLIVLVAAPAYALQRLTVLGVSTPVPLALVAGGGTTLSVLSAARRGLRPSRLFGPVSVAASAAALGYLIGLSTNARFSVPFGSGISVTLGFSQLLSLLLVPVALSLVAGVVTTFEDAFRPRERLPYDFPP